MTTRGPVICFGEILFDEMPDGRRLLGGAPLNQASRLAGLGIEVLMASRVGDDEDGRAARDYLARIGIDDRLVQTDAAIATGRVTVSPASGGESYIIHAPAAYDALQPTDALLEAVGRARALSFGTLIRRGPVAAATLDAAIAAAPQAAKLLDVNLRNHCYTRQSVDRSLESCDIARMSIEEAAWLTEEFHLSCDPLREPQGFCLAAIERWSLSCCCVSRGEKGLLAADRTGAFVEAPAVATAVVDTVGAGDACSAGLLAGLLNNQPLERACELAARCAAQACQSPGGPSA